VAWEGRVRRVPLLAPLTGCHAGDNLMWHARNAKRGALHGTRGRQRAGYSEQSNAGRHGRNANGGQRQNGVAVDDMRAAMRKRYAAPDRPPASASLVCDLQRLWLTSQVLRMPRISVQYISC